MATQKRTSDFRNSKEKKMNWYLIIKFFHIIAVVMFVGGVFARQLVHRFAKISTDIQAFATFNHAAGQIENILVIPGSNATLVLGIILGLSGGLPILGFLQGAAKNWLLVSNILIIGGLVIVLTVFIPRGKKFESMLQAALAKGEITSELHAAMDDRVVNFAHLYQEISLIAIVALMVLKPF
jgi:uncharacterized membrane protein